MAGKKYYWFKLKDNFFIDPRMKKLRRMAGGNTYTTILLKIMLETLKTDGILIYEAIENTLSEELSLKLDEEEIDVSATLMFMNQMKLIEEIDKNKYLLPEVVKAIGRESDSAERVRKFRERKKSKLLHCNENVTIEKEVKLDLKKETLSKSLSSKNKQLKKEDFNSFKKRIKHIYEGKPLVSGALDYANTTVISIASTGYLFNEVSQKDLTPEDAKRVWKWVFENQGKLELI